jgi:hypothetical protein
LWDVQAILAERISPWQSGGSEVLVVWKPSWIPIENVPDGLILSSFRAAPKAHFQSTLGKIVLPMEPKTALADDVATAERQILLQRERFQGYGSAQQQKRVDGTPRKSLGSVAKRVPVPSKWKPEPKKQ